MSALPQTKSRVRRGFYPPESSLFGGRTCDKLLKQRSDRDARKLKHSIPLTIDFAMIFCYNLFYSSRSFAMNPALLEKIESEVAISHQIDLAWEGYEISLIYGIWKNNSGPHSSIVIMGLGKSLWTNAPELFDKPISQLPQHIATFVEEFKSFVCLISEPHSNVPS